MLRHTLLANLLLVTIAGAALAQESSVAPVARDLANLCQKLGDDATAAGRKGGFGLTLLAVSGRSLAQQASSLQQAAQGGDEPVADAFNRYKGSLASFHRALARSGLADQFKETVDLVDQLTANLDAALKGQPAPAPIQPAAMAPAPAPATAPAAAQIPAPAPQAAPAPEGQMPATQTPEGATGASGTVLDLSATPQDVTEMVKDLGSYTRRLVAMSRSRAAASELRSAAQDVQSADDAGNAASFKQALVRYAQALDRYEADQGDSFKGRSTLVKVFDLARGLARRAYVLGQ